MNHHQGNLHTYMHTGAKRNIYLICVWTRHGIDWDQRDRNTLTCIYIHIIFQRLTPLRLSAPTLSRGCSTDGSLTFVHAPLALPAEHSLGARGRSVDTPPTLLGRFADVPWALPRALSGRSRDTPETLPPAPPREAPGSTLRTRDAKFPRPPAKNTRHNRTGERTPAPIRRSFSENPHFESQGGARRFRAPSRGTSIATSPPGSNAQKDDTGNNGG